MVYRSAIKRIVLIFMFLILPGCVAVNPNSDHEGGRKNATLYEWVDKDLLPYLSRELSVNPYFKGRPFLIVPMREDEIEPNIDSLSSDIRRRLYDGLRRVRGVNLIWRPAQRPWEHHTSIKDIRCGELQPIEIYLGIEITQSPVNENVRISLNALDITEERWVTGFGDTWEGIMSASELRAMNLIRPDEHLRGLRPLPFTSEQVDLAASYLARNLSCLFNESGDDIILYQESRDRAHMPEVALRVFDLVDNYLGKLSEVSVTESENKANIKFRREIKQITGNLYQIWIQNLSQDEDQLRVKETEVYIQL